MRGDPEGPWSLVAFVVAVVLVAFACSFVVLLVVRSMGGLFE